VFKYVLSATVIAAGWSTLMLLIELIQLIMGRKLRSTIWRAIVCIGDWVSHWVLGVPWEGWVCHRGLDMPSAYCG